MLDDFDCVPAVPGSQIGQGVQRCSRLRRSGGQTDFAVGTQGCPERFGRIALCQLSEPFAVGLGSCSDARGRGKRGIRSAAAASNRMSCIHIVDILERASCLHWEDCKALLRATDNPAITATSLKQAKSGVFAPHQPLPKLATALALHK
jgi:hypothetical protein